MYTSKLMQLIRNLSAEEMRWLAKFVRSPYHNSNRDVTALFDHIRKYHPAYESIQLSKENVFRKIWPKRVYNDRQLRLLMFRLSDLVEEFMVAHLIRHDRLRFGQHLVSALAERDLYDLFVRKTEALLEALEEQPYRDEQYYALLWHLKWQWSAHPETTRLQIPTASLHEISELLDNYYAIVKFRSSSDLVNRQNILPGNYDITLLRELRALVPDAPVFRKNKVLHLYHDLLQLLEQPLHESYYYRLETSFLENQVLLKKADQNVILRCLINATTQLYISGRSEYLQNQFHLYQLGLQNDLLIEKGKLPESTFLNIVVSGTILKELAWIRPFIDQYAGLISNNILNFAEAYWHFAGRQFHRSNDFLARVKEQDISHQLRKKLLSLRNHYEIFLSDDSYYTLFLDESRAFEKFVRRNNQITEKRAKAYLNFLTYIRKIGKLKAENRKVKQEHKAGLREDIINLQPLEARPWLLEKIDEV